MGTPIHNWKKLTVSKTTPVPSSVSSLDDRYTKTTGAVFLSGNQALVRLPIQQRLLDQAAGLNTGGYVSGYRGSPLGRYDMEMWSAAKYLEPLNIKGCRRPKTDPVGGQNSIGANTLGFVRGEPKGEFLWS